MARHEPGFHYKTVTVELTKIDINITAVLQHIFKTVLVEGYFSFCSTDRNW